MILEEQIKGRLERLERQIDDLEREASRERSWSDRRQRLDAAIGRLKTEKKMLEGMLDEA